MAKGINTLNCALCKQSKKLCQSHIIPEFFYEHIYDDKHCFRQYSTNPIDKPPIRQQGIWEQLLCLERENKINKWEDYAKRILFGSITLRTNDINNGCIFYDIDYTRFKLFQMSLLWRAAITTRPEFSNVILGPHEERLRQMILTEDSGKFFEYGCMILYPPQKSVRHVFSKVIAPPDMIKSRGHHLYRFLLGPSFWLYFVSNHMSNLTNEDISLQENGELIIRSGGRPMLRYLHRFAGEIGEAKQ